MDEYDYIPKRGSKLSTNELKALAQLNIIQMGKIPLKSGKMPANDNAFIITDLGRAFIRQSLAEHIPISEAVLKVRHEISQANTQMEIIKHKIVSLEEKIHKIDSFVSNLESRTSQPTRVPIEKQQLLKAIVEAENLASSEYRSGPLFNTEIYYKRLSQLGLKDNEINDILYSLFEETLLDLQMGPSSSGQRGVRTLSGKVYNWGKYRGDH